MFLHVRFVNREEVTQFSTCHNGYYRWMYVPPDTWWCHQM